MPSTGTTSRRAFLSQSAAALTVLACGTPAARSDRDSGEAFSAADTAGDGGQSFSLLIGTYTKDGRSRGIYRSTVDARTLAFGASVLVAETPDPSFLALSPDRRTLLAVNELLTFEGAAVGSITAFAHSSQRLTVAGPARSTGGAAPCYVTMDATGKYALVANYMGGNLAVLPLAADGTLGEPMQVVAHTGTGPDRARQEAPHAHCVVLDGANRFAVAADLGADTLFVYRFDATRGTLSPAATPSVKLPPGAGPRHVAFSPDGRTLYCANELDSTLAVFAYDGSTGALAARGVVSTRPPGATGDNAPADIHVHPDGRTVYLSNRGDNTIAVFAVAADTGAVSLVQTIASGGDWPRNFALTPDGRGLLVAHQRSDSVVAFRIAEDTGQLVRAGTVLTTPVPVCLLFA